MLKAKGHLHMRTTLLGEGDLQSRSAVALSPDRRNRGGPTRPRHRCHPVRRATCAPSSVPTDTAHGSRCGIPLQSPEFKRSRDARYPAPTAQIPACSIPGSSGPRGCQHFAQPSSRLEVLMGRAAARLPRDHWLNILLSRCVLKSRLVPMNMWMMIRLSSNS